MSKYPEISIAMAQLATLTTGLLLVAAAFMSTLNGISWLGVAAVIGGFGWVGLSVALRPQARKALFGDYFEHPGAK